MPFAKLFLLSRFWRASELTILELIGSVNTSAFVGTNPTGEVITSGFAVSREQSPSIGKAASQGNRLYDK